MSSFSLTLVYISLSLTLYTFINIRNKNKENQVANFESLYSRKIFINVPAYFRCDFFSRFIFIFIQNELLFAEPNQTTARLLVQRMNEMNECF